MFYAQLLRQEADRYRSIATHTTDRKVQEENEDLAEVMEEVANEVEEKESPG